MVFAPPHEPVPPLTPREVGRLLGVSEVSVRRWIASGRLEGMRLGDGPLARYRIRLDALEDFVRDGSTDSE